jgi:hypothetical protein
MPRKQTYVPQKTFDIDFEGLVNLLSGKNFTCSAVDIEQCKQEVLQQRLSRAAYEALKASYFEAHKRFVAKQRDRHKLYGRLLSAARGAFREDPAMLAALANFQRKVSHRTPTVEEQHDSGAPAAQPSQVLPKIAIA